MEMNLNETVWVKLTKLGEETFLDHYRSLLRDQDIPYPLPTPNSDRGWTPLLMHELMSIFGSKLCIGFENQFEGSIIRFNPPL